MGVIELVETFYNRATLLRKMLVYFGASLEIEGENFTGWMLQEIHLTFYYFWLKLKDRKG